VIRPYLKTLLVTLALIAAQHASALTLTPEQQRQLDALPESQRQQLMQQYQQAKRSQGGANETSGQSQQQVPQEGKQPGVVPLGDRVQVAPQTSGSGASQPGRSEQGEDKEEKEEKTAEQILKEEYRKWRAASGLGSDDLLPFGYEMFAGEPTSFVASSDAPVPVGYRVGPGDEIRVLLTGRENQDLSLTVSRSGTIEIPQVGPVNVHGKTLEELRSYLQGLIRERFIGVESFVSLGELRSISVFLTGESRNPGVYSVSAFSTLSHALSVSGGIKISGSLRNIRLIRNGETVSHFDLYDLMLAGDRGADLQLESGDVIFIPAASQRVSVSGAVVRPAVYELGQKNTLEQAIKLAGGLRAEADPSKIQISRLRPDSKRTLLDLNFANSKNQQLVNGDTLRIGKIHDRLRGSVEVRGASPISGTYQWQRGMRLSRLLNNRDDHLNDDADLDFGVIVSRTGENFDVSLRRFTPRDVIAQSGTQADPILKERDSVLLFKDGESRQGMLEPVLGAFRQGLNIDELPALVSVAGAVRHPGTYPLLENHSINDMIHFAGGVARGNNSLVSADLEFGMLIRRQGELGRVPQAIRYNPGNALNNPNSSDNLPVQEMDRILVFSRTENRGNLLEPLLEELRQNLLPGQQPTVVSITGAVRHPGSYPLLPGTTVRDLLAYAGGLTNASYQLEAELIRQRLTAQRAESELVKLELQNPDHQSLTLQPTDRIHIKQIPDLNLQQTVTLEGEVNFPGTYTIRRGETLAQVIERAGGLTEFAYAKGAVFTRERLREQEQQRLNEAQRRLRRDLAISGPQSPGEVDTVEGDDETVIRVLDQVADAQAVGRLVIDLPELLAGNTARDVRLQDGDTLTIPEISQAVSVMGEVQFATSHLHDATLSIRDYINRSGGLAFQADEQRIYVIKADGSVTVPNQSRWFGRTNPVEPGDTIVVPLNLSQLSSIELAKDVSQIIYQVALGAAAVRSFRD
jgi:polysaccharide export outer membrane protein